MYSSRIKNTISFKIHELTEITMVLSKHQLSGVWISIFSSLDIKATRKQRHLGDQGLHTAIYLQWELLKCWADFSQICNKNYKVCLCYLKWWWTFMMKLFIRERAQLGLASGKEIVEQSFKEQRIAPLNMEICHLSVPLFYVPKLENYSFMPRHFVISKLLLTERIV